MGPGLHRIRHTGTIKFRDNRPAPIFGRRGVCYKYEENVRLHPHYRPLPSFVHLFAWSPRNLRLLQYPFPRNPGNSYPCIPFHPCQRLPPTRVQAQILHHSTDRVRRHLLKLLLRRHPQHLNQVRLHCKPGPVISRPENSRIASEHHTSHPPLLGSCSPNNHL